MKIDTKILSGFLDSKIRDYQKRVNELEHMENKDDKLISKYENYIECLSELDCIFMINPWEDNHPIFNLLVQNHKKFDTEFILTDGTDEVITKSDIISIKDNFLLIYYKEDFEKDHTVIPRTCRILNLDNVKWVNTLR